MISHISADFTQTSRHTFWITVRDRLSPRRTRNLRLSFGAALRVGGDALLLVPLDVGDLGGGQLGLEVLGAFESRLHGGDWYVKSFS